MADLSTPNNAQAATVAEIIQRVRPDVLLINEFDFDAARRWRRLFQDNYLSVPHNGAPPPIDYPYASSRRRTPGSRPASTSTTTGASAGPDDAFGFGFFPGQFGMAVYSHVSDRHDGVRTFQTSSGRTCRARCLPDDPATPAPADWYSPAELDVFRLSSKSHWDLPIDDRGKIVHFLVSHPTPPVFDGPEDRNGTRNHDEIRFWADYISPGRQRATSTTTRAAGGLKPGALFVIAGDQNSDPLDGDSIPGSIQQLLDHPLVNTKLTPSSRVPSSRPRSRAARTPRTERPGVRHGRLRRRARPGNLRADYVLPRKNLQIVDAARLLAALDRSAVPPGRDVPVPELGPPARLDRTSPFRRLARPCLRPGRATARPALRREGRS